MNFIYKFNLFKNSLLKKENLILFFIVLTAFLCDRVAKIKALNYLIEGNIYYNEFLNFNLIWNTGIGFGLFKSNSIIIYNLITTLISIVIIVLTYYAINSKIKDKLVFSIIIGGALGNLYDRYFYSAVPDFIDLHYKNFHWFTFNVADIFITIGIISFIFKDVFIRKI